MSEVKEKIAYEPHPVTPERKKELRDQGYKIIDARFDPNRKAAPKTAAKTDGEDENKELEALKVEAAALNVKFSPSIGFDTLKTRVDEAKAAKAAADAAANGGDE